MNLLRITILIENSSFRNDLESEHGLSFLIETRDGQSVFDTGASSRFATNAAKLGIDLSKTDRVILSHGHYDHTGGLSTLCRKVFEIPIYCQPTATIPRYSIKNPLEPKQVGIPADSLESLKYHPVVDTSSPKTIGDTIHITGFVPRLMDYEDVGGPFFLDPIGKNHDLIPDDQALWFNSEQGIVVLLGCAHAGVINTLQYCKNLSGIDHIHAVIGGFHLVNADNDRLEQTVKALQQLNPNILAPCHCTGKIATQRLAQEFPHSFTKCTTGSVFTFPA